VSLSQDIKEYALDLGYSKVGIAAADGFPAYIEDLNSRHDMYTWYLEGPRQPIKGAEPRSLMPSARSIISLIYDYYRESFPESLGGKIARLYQARCYNAPEHRINGARRKLMLDFLSKNGVEVGLQVVVPEKLTAARAGIITYGRNSFAFADGIGSFIMLTSFVVNAELECADATPQMDCPPKCSACIEACPTKAIYDPPRMNPRRCITYNTSWTQDGVPGETSYILPDIREKMGTWIHGCDICQDVCPRNRGKLKADLPRNEFLERVAEDFELTKVLNMTDEFYIRRVQPLMYNYLKEKKYFQRNAAIALGNTRDPAFVPALARAMEDPEELVRGYAAWAMGRIGGGKASNILQAALRRETAESARREMQAALVVV
jgi:epoxyqueuosine reductase